MEQLPQFRWWVASDWAIIVQVLGPPLSRGFILALLTWYLAGAARSGFEHATGRTAADPNLRLLIGRIVYLAVLAIGGITLLDNFGVPLTAIATALGVIGLGVGLALQDILKNFFAGTYLLFERPFRLGDEISVKDNRGVVETIGIRTTKLRTAENVEVMIPNAIMFAEVVANRTYERPIMRDASDGAAVADDATKHPASGQRLSIGPLAGLSVLGYSPASTFGRRVRDLGANLLDRTRTLGG